MKLHKATIFLLSVVMGSLSAYDGISELIRYDKISARKAVGMLGGGAWGTAVATLLAHNGYDVYLWCHEQDVAYDIDHNHINSRFLPGVVLPSSIHATNDIRVVFDSCAVIFEAVPVAHIRRVLSSAKPYIHNEHRFVILSKGIEQETLLLPSQIISAVLGVDVVAAIAAGPSFAAELASKKITALDVASTDPDFTDEVRALLKSDYCCPVSSPDPVGIQCGSALKNVLALGMGILEGANQGENTKAFVFTRGLEELASVSRALGGLPQTLYGVSGIGDLVLTALGSASRNNQLGQGLGRGEVLEDIVKRLGTVPESLNTCISLHQFCTLYEIKAPVLEGIYQMVYEKLSVADFLHNLIEFCLKENRHRTSIKIDDI